jgi:hypothetical protein
MTTLPSRAVSFSSWIGKSAMVARIVIDGKKVKKKLGEAQEWQGTRPDSNSSQRMIDQFRQQISVL